MLLVLVCVGVLLSRRLMFVTVCVLATASVFVFV